MRERFERDELIALVERHLPGTSADVRLAPVPTGKFNTSFYVATGGREYVLRIAPPTTPCSASTSAA